MINSDVMRVRTDDVLSLASNSQQPPVEINDDDDDDDDDDNNGNEDSQMPIDEDATPIRT